MKTEEDEDDGTHVSWRTPPWPPSNVPMQYIQGNSYVRTSYIHGRGPSWYILPEDDKGTFKHHSVWTMRSLFSKKFWIRGYMLLYICLNDFSSLPPRTLDHRVAWKLSSPYIFHPEVHENLSNTISMMFVGRVSAISNQLLSLIFLWGFELHLQGSLLFQKCYMKTIYVPGRILYLIVK